jgi:hypothetical protein
MLFLRWLKSRSWIALSAMMIIAGTPLSADARDETLRWTHPGTNPDGLPVTFRVYVGDSPRTYSRTENVGQPARQSDGTYVHTVSVSGDAYFAVAAIADQIEGPRSNEIFRPGDSSIASGDTVSPSAVRASSENSTDGQLAVKVVDRVIDGWPGDHTREWATAGEKAGAWIELSWNTPQSLESVALYDRPNSNDHILAGTLRFSDGSSVPVGRLDNSGDATSVRFAARTVTSVRFTIDSVAATTSNVGLAEFEVFQSGEPSSACGDADADGCDDCAMGARDPANDGLDTDGDGLCNVGDPDDDGDGFVDASDAAPLDSTRCADNDMDGCDDCAMGMASAFSDGPDFDADGWCDRGDPDDDNDGVSDAADTASRDSRRCADSDADGCDDCSGGTRDPSNDGADLDRDGMCDAGDPDDDGDGVADSADTAPRDPRRCADSDADSCDDCSGGTRDPANDGADLDGDGKCDAGDRDDDGDGVADSADPAPRNPLRCGDTDADTCDDCAKGARNPAMDGTDTDGDGLCDAGDPDADGDGVNDDDVVQGPPGAPILLPPASPASE